MAKWVKKKNNTQTYRSGAPNLSTQIKSQVWCHMPLQANAGKAETGGFWGLAGQLIYPNQWIPGSERDCVSKTIWIEIKEDSQC